jgi:UDP:flavonoid glycosyltransferase YjiC (YdhE family)
MPGLGHFHPLVPLAHALVRAGHAVIFAAASTFHPQIARAGFKAFAAGIDERQMHDELRRRGQTGDPTPPERQRRRMATDIGPPAMLPDLLLLLNDWRADVLVHEEGEYSGPLAASLAGIPHVTHGWPAPLMPHERARRIGSAMAPLWRQCGVDPPPTAGLYHHLYVDCCPPSLQDHAIAGVPTARPVRPVLYDGAGGEDSPGWLATLADRPTIYATLGTVPVFNSTGDVFGIILDAFRDEPCNLIVTVGPGNDPAALGPQPAHVHIERYVPQTRLLPHCDLVVCHGGASTTTAALTHGLPVLVLPRGSASQQRTAEACVAGGVGRMLVGADVTSAAVRRAARALLDDQRYRRRAREVADEIRCLPAPDEVVNSIERCAERV